MLKFLKLPYVVFPKTNHHRNVNVSVSVSVYNILTEFLPKTPEYDIRLPFYHVKFSAILLKLGVQVIQGLEQIPHPIIPHFFSAY